MKANLDSNSAFLLLTLACFLLSSAESFLIDALFPKTFKLFKKEILTKDGPADFTPIQTLFLGLVTVTMLAGKFMGFLPLNVNKLYKTFAKSRVGENLIAGGYSNSTTTPSTTVFGDFVTAGDVTTTMKSREARAFGADFVLDYEYDDVLGHAIGLVRSDPISCINLLICEVEKAHEKFAGLNEEFNEEQNFLDEDSFTSTACIAAEKKCHLRVKEVAGFLRNFT